MKTMSNHPVLAQLKLDVKQSVKDYIIQAIELDMVLESLTQKDPAVQRIKDLIKNV